MLTLLQQAVERGCLRALDLHFARLLADDNAPLLMLLAATVSAQAGEGHVCLPLSRFTPERLFAGREPQLAAEMWQRAGSPDLLRCLDLLQRSEAVSEGDKATPLVLSHGRLYLQRMWRDEGRIAHYLQHASGSETESETLPEILDQLFGPAEPGSDINWQKVAAAVAVTRQVAVISGGPGTGKTTTVARLLAVLILLNQGRALRIQLAAPTGKAAARLAEALSHTREQLQRSLKQSAPDVLAQFPEQATTLHRLLGAYGQGGEWRYHKSNPLHLDILLVDEASMVDLPMMARLVDALPPGARLLLLGDRDQLASVEAGAVLGDLCRLAEQGYSPQRARQLSRLTGYSISGEESSEAFPLRDNLCLLRKSYRFAEHSGIGHLAEAVNRGQSRQALACFSGQFSDLAWYPLQSSDDYGQLLSLCVHNYGDYLSLVAQGADAGTILRAFNRFQLLCALRDGPFGVRGLNERIEQALQQQGLIRRSSTSQRLWYYGRPIMVSRNDRLLELYNGDIGIVLADEQGEPEVCFLLPDGSIRTVPPYRLPEHDTAYAMTVHKSQGSEFDHTLLVLPDRFTPLLTRELLYTAITRARQQLTLLCSDTVFSKAVHTVTERSSGLLERLQQAL
ncbi:MAG: exodeoxyribonuclease V subunit alpha [Enterobacteriaceae bacterium]